MSDLGRNEIADLKHEKPPAGSHFRPRALRALGRKWKPLGGFSCLRSAIPFLPSSLMQKLPIFLILKSPLPHKKLAFAFARKILLIRYDTERAARKFKKV